MATQPRLPGMPRAQPAPTLSAEQFDPGPDYVRGSVPVGQTVMDFDRPERHHGGPSSPPIHTKHGMIEDREGMDPSLWNFGGAEIEDDDLVAKWRSAPIKTFGADSQIYTGQHEEETDESLPAYREMADETAEFAGKTHLERRDPHGDFLGRDRLTDLRQDIWDVAVDDHAYAPDDPVPTALQYGSPSALPTSEVVRQQNKLEGDRTGAARWNVVRSGQGAQSAPDPMLQRAASGDLLATHRRFSVDDMREQETIHNKPWVVEAEDGRHFALDGNHRIGAMRRRQDGVVDAHVLPEAELRAWQASRPSGQSSRPSSSSSSSGRSGELRKGWL